MAEREFEQQEFMRTLADEVYDYCDQKESEQGEHVDELIISCAAELLHWLSYRMAADRSGKTVLFPSTYGDLMLSLSRKIREFIRIPEEEVYVWYKLFNEFEPTMRSMSSREYINKCINDPEAAYGPPANERSV